MNNEIKPLTEEETLLLEAELNQSEEITEEYLGNTDSIEASYEEIPIYEIKPVEKPKFYEFKTIKNFQNKINYIEIERINQNLKYCQNIVDLFTESIGDDLLYEAIIPSFPNVKPITSPEDRLVLRKMLLQGHNDCLYAYGQAFLDSWVKESRHMGLVFNNKTDEIAGCYQITHQNSLACNILIWIRGSFKDKAKTAKEMVTYFGSRYINLIHEQKYKYIIAMTLTKTHASLVENIRKKEYKIILDRLKTENPSRSIEELNEASKKLIPGFKNTGTTYPRMYEGSIVWETNWRYDLQRKFN